MAVDGVSQRKGWVSGLLAVCGSRRNRSYKLITDDPFIVREYRQFLQAGGVDSFVYAETGSKYHVYAGAGYSVIDNLVDADPNGESFILGWLSGVFDGRGKVRFVPRKANPNKVDYYLEVCSSNKPLIDRFMLGLSSLGIGSRLVNIGRDGSRSTIIKLRVSRSKDVESFASKIPIICPHKISELNDLVGYLNRK